MHSKIRRDGNSFVSTLEKETLRELGVVDEDELVDEVLARQTVDPEDRRIIIEIPELD